MDSEKEIQLKCGLPGGKAEGKARVVCGIHEYDPSQETATEAGARVRKFSSGATRDTDQGKFDYEAFFSPAVLERRAEFMHRNRKQSDGSLRDGDNWQKGMSLDVYAKSAARHYLDFWKAHRGIPTQEDIEDVIAALMFNLEGYLFETLKKKSNAPR